MVSIQATKYGVIYINKHTDNGIIYLVKKEMGGECSFGLLVGFAFYLNVTEIYMYKVAFANYWNIALYFIFFFLGKIVYCFNIRVFN